MSQISFKINGIKHEVDGKYGPDVSLNEYIRNVAGLPGTKVMCREGGCGACIVAVHAASPPNYEVKTFSVNSCLVSVLSCHGWEITTVEGLGNRVIGYHEIQTRLAQFNGTQCGYCTPGWIMQMYSLYEANNKNLTIEQIENSFASNICRCTGYRPIVDAFKSFANNADKKLVDKLIDLEDLGFVKKCGVTCKENCYHKKSIEDKSGDGWCMLKNNYSDGKIIIIDCGSHMWYKAYNLKDVFDAMGSDNEYKLIAGNTGQGVYHVTDYPKNVIDISDVPELKGYLLDVNLVLGAGMSLTDMMEAFQKLSTEHEEFTYLKQFYEHMDLVAHIPVRNIGTIGGNLLLKYLNKEFQSDIFLLFETVGATITVAENVTQQKQMAISEIFNLDMKGKILLKISLPPLSKNCLVKTYKIMPRSQNAHAVVNAGFFFRLNENFSNVEEARIAYGNITPDFTRASKTESILVGKHLYSDETLQLALKTLAEEVIPEHKSVEPSPNYRKMLALALYYKAILCLCPPEKVNPKFISDGDVLKRITSAGTQTYDTDKSVWPLNEPIPKIEGIYQCSGEAIFANDLPKDSCDVYGAFVTANVPPGNIIENFDTAEAFKLSGVIAFYSAKDIPGKNTFTPKNTSIPIIVNDEEILCQDKVKFFGQAAGIIVANRELTAVKAAKLVKIKYKSKQSKKALITITDVLKSDEKAERVHTDRTVKPEDKGKNVNTVVEGEFSIESQYHYYMELQTCVARPTENGMDVFSSTQWLDLTNIAVANCLGIPVNSVNVIVRRLGGAYGGKITRATQIACAASLVCHLQGKPCRFMLPLETNMQTIGKRLPTMCKFEIGVDNEGEIQYLNNTFYQNNGCSSNESAAFLTIEHFRNCYDTKRWYMEGNSVSTDLPSNTFCRAPSSTEGVAMIEYIMEKIAFTLKKDPIDIRLLNISKTSPIPEMIEQMKTDCEYGARKLEIVTYNSQNRWRKRSLKLLPLEFNIQYLAGYNSLVSIFHGDGTVSITHGGIEMGQGLNTKVAQVCAHVLGIPLKKVNIKPSASETSPNSLVTGGSIGSECIAFATVKACQILNNRLEPFKRQMSNASFEDVVEAAFKAGVDLRASYCFTNTEGDLKPYNVYAVCALEVEVDILTGNHEVRRVDLLEDTGRSLSPEIDVGQIEGAFVMGLGYWTSEKLIYDAETGQLLTDRTWTYKPPGIKDIPADMRIYFRRNGENEFGVLQSKATGEPALCLATVIIHAIREAISFARLDAEYEDQWVEIDNPCTVESIFNAVGHKLEHFKLN